MSTPRANTPRQNGRKHFQSPKKARKKRTPRCDSCGKRDGDDAGEGAPPGAKVKLKICARCRGVAYCSATCQRAKWATHRDRCVHVEPPIPAGPRPPVSPSSSTRSNRQYKVLTGPGTVRSLQRKSVAAGVTTTPRNREKAPTKHPFFGNQHDTSSRIASSVPHVTPLLSGRQRALQQQVYQPPQQRLGSEDGSRSPPKTSRSKSSDGHRDGTAGRMGNNPVKIIRVSSTSRLQPQQHRRRSEDGAAVSPPARWGVSLAKGLTRDYRAQSSPGERILRVPTSVKGRMQGVRKVSPPPSSPTRRHTFGPEASVARGDPPPLPPRQPADESTTGGRGDLNRRLSAPLFPASLEDKRRVRVKEFAAATSGDGSRRGPPPPYSSVAHRAPSVGSRAKSTFEDVLAPVPASQARSLSGSGLEESKVELSLPPRSIPPPTVSPMETTSSAHEGVFHSAGAGVPQKVSEGVAQVGGGDSAEGRQSNKIISAAGEQQEDRTTVLEDGVKSTITKEISPGSAASAAAAKAALASLEAGEHGTKLKLQDGGVGKTEESDNTTNQLHERGAHGESATCSLTPVALSPCGDEINDSHQLVGPSPTGHVSAQVRHSAPPVPPGHCPSSAISTGYAERFTRSSTSSPQDDAPDGGSPSSSGRRFSPRPRPPVSPGPALSPSSYPLKPPSVLPEVFVEETYLASPSTSNKGDEETLPSKETPAAPADTERLEAGRAVPRTAMSLGKLQPGPRVFAANESSLSPSVLPFVPVVEFSPEKKPPTPHNPGPRRTDTARFYQRRLGRFRGSGLPPASNTYLGRPAGFSVHVLVASAPTSVDLAAPPDAPLLSNDQQAEFGAAVPATEEKAVPPALKAARAERALRYASGTAQPWVFYSFEERGRLAVALRAGDVVLLTPGRYEARSWGLQHLLSSVEIIGVGAAKACVVYNNPAPAASPYSNNCQAQHYLIGVMGNATAGGSNGNGIGACGEKSGSTIENVDDDSDSGWEDGVFGAAAAAAAAATNEGSTSSKGSGRGVCVRLANLTLEQRSGYRGALYQLGHESHLELDGCVVRCSQGGVNVDQGTCLICDCTIEGSEAFGVHIGGEGVVEHCYIRDCGRGGGPGGRARRVSPVSPMSRKETTFGETECKDGEDELDDGTEVNRDVGMPAISVLQRSRVRVRFNVIRENAGHALQYRDAALTGGEGKRALLARRAQMEAEEVSVIPILFTSWGRVAFSNGKLVTVASWREHRVLV